MTHELRPGAAELHAGTAAIKFALEADCGLDFLRCWCEGEFDVIRREWPDAPTEVFLGADPLLNYKGKPFNPAEDGTGARR